MHYLKSWMRRIRPDEPVVVELFEDIEIEEPEPFVTYPCSECNADVVVVQSILPGQVAVTDCENCGVSWTFYNPSLIIRRTTDIPEEIQERTWGILSQ